MTATVYFEIREQRTDRLREYERVNKEALDRDDWTYHSRYSDGAEAAREVERLKQRHPEYSFCIIKRDPSAGDKNWRTREITRLMDGTYKLVPGILPIDKPEHIVSMSADDYARHYGGRTFHDLLMQAQFEQFVHLSQSDEKKLAFTENAQKGEKDKQKVMSPMAYISRHIPHSWAEPIQDLFIEAMGGLDIKLLFAKTREEFVEIYTECDSSRYVGSCMSHPTGNYESDPIHPVEVYAAGDLQLCYVRENGDSGKIWGRCLVWPERKTWGRIYSTNASLMRKALKAAGYESGEREDSLVGAKLNVIWHNESYGRLVMPYIDNSFCAYYDHESKQLTIAAQYEGNIDATSTSGLADIGSANNTQCDRCGDYYNSEDTGGYIENGDLNYCQYCYENYSFHCENCQETYSTNSETMCHTPYDYGVFCQPCFDDRYHSCEDCHETTDVDDISYHEASDRHLCSDCFAERDAEAEEGDQEAPQDTNAALAALCDNVTGAIERGEAEAIAGIPAQTSTRPYFPNCSIDNPSIAEGFPELPYTHCYWRPRFAGDAPPYWTQRAFNSRLVQRGEENHGNLRLAFWDYTTITDEYLYAVPTYCVTGIYCEYRPELEQQLAQGELAA